MRSSWVIRVNIIIIVILLIGIIYQIPNAFVKDTPFHGMFNTFADNIGLHANSTFGNGKVSKADIDNVIISQDYIRKYFSAADEELRIRWLRVIKHFIRLPLDRWWGSHQLVLLATSILTAGGGPVLEMGCGHFSTILLREIIVVDQKRHLLSADTDLAWLSKFEKNFSSTLHHFRHINETSEWDSMSTNRPKWSFVLVDHKPGERRITDIIRMVDMSDVVIMHDTETMPINNQTGLALYPYRYRFKHLIAHTDVMSKNNGTIINDIQRLVELAVTFNITI